MDLEEPNKLMVIEKKPLITKIIEYVLSTRWFILLIGILILLKTLLFYTDTVFHNDKIWFWSVRQTCLFIVIIVFPLLLFRKPLRRFEFGTIINFFISLLLFSDELYYSYASNILSIMQTGNLQYKDEIIAAIPSLLNKRQILYFIDIVLISILFICKKIKIKNPLEKKFKIIPAVATLICIFFFCTSYHLIPESLELVTGYIYSKYKSVRYGTIYGYHFVDIMNALTNNKSAIYDEYDEMIEKYDELKNYKKEYSEENKTPEIENLDSMCNGIAKGKNVFVIQLEAIQNFVIDKKINGKEITPNLNKFLHENLNVSNMHSSSYTTTADSEHSFITSIFPAENGEAFSKYYSNTYDDIFKKFKDAGYTNIYAHGNYDTFWNRKNVYSKYDVDYVYFIDSFEDKSELIRTYLSDELLYKQIFDMIPETNDEPIFVDLVAASSHKPFELSGIVDKYSKVSIDVGKYSQTQLGNYLEAANYADYAFGIFLNEMKEHGYYENSVICVYGDHYGMSMYDENLIEFLGEDKYNYNVAKMQHAFSNVVCGFKIPGINNVEISYPTNKIDLKPTLFQLCGLKDDFALGESIFTPEPFSCINNGNIITNGYYYDTQNWYKMSDGSLVNLENCDEDIRKYLKDCEKYTTQELGISMSVLTENLLHGVLDT